MAPTSEIKTYISRRLYAAWKVGSGTIEDAQLFGRVDELYLRVAGRDLLKVIVLYNRELWQMHAESPLLTPMPTLIKTLESQSDRATEIRSAPPNHIGPQGWKYEVALSFAGEDRSYVEEVANLLRAHGVSVFYDRYEEADFWGKNLQEHLADVYQNKSRYVVMFVSKNYAAKVWPTHERRSALARAVSEKREYVLPVRIDNTELPGLLPTIAYVNLAGKTPQQLSELILLKLGRV